MSKKTGIQIAGISVSYVVLILFAALALLPLLYMLSLSLQTDTEVLASTPVLWPAVPQFQNYLEIWQIAPFARFFLMNGNHVWSKQTTTETRKQ
jgi:multiple sugar transport system permease protein